MELNKLIEQYEAETGKVAYEGDLKGNCDFYKDFVIWLASRPTCTETERKFLDRLREGKLITVTYGTEMGIVLGEDSLFWESDFPDINLRELVE